MYTIEAERAERIGGGIEEFQGNPLSMNDQTSDDPEIWGRPTCVKDQNTK